ncbi:MAG: thioredoxin family protein [Rhodospirillales bacterium]|nr:thioredoxin family protein [Rhodospirillales bacterium]
MIKGLRLLTLISLLCAGVFPAAADVVTSNELTAKLVSENSQVASGETVTIALHQKMAPGWHTYWVNPGDSGQPPMLSWQLPEGVSVEQSSWPAPHRLPVGPLVNYGYSDEIALLYEVTIPETWPAGEVLPLRADAEILVCEEICIPVTGTLALDIPTGGETRKDNAVAPMFANARAEQPLPTPWPAMAYAVDGRVGVILSGPAADFATVSDAYVYPEKWGVVNHAAPQTFGLGADGLVITAPPGEGSAGEMFSGVVTLKQDGAPDRSFKIDNVPVVTTAPPVMNEGGAQPNVWLLIALALAGGVLLNLMPCVFPVLAVKALSLTKHADAQTWTRLAHGGAYTSGVVASFLILAAALLALRAGGDAIGWGFQLQEPLVVGALAYVAALVGLNLSGVFEISGRFAGAGSAWTHGPGISASFATGVLAAVVAAPCTAPFMATATGGALLLEWPGALSVFAALGFGLALPYLLLTAMPGLSRLLPKPGAWMVRFKQLLAFPMYATAAWLIWVLSLQAGPDAAFLAMLGLIAIAFACWAWPSEPLSGSAVYQGVRLALVLVPLLGAGALLGWVGVNAEIAPAQQQAATDIAEPYSEARLTRHQAAGRTVFVNMTAAWCITCKVNERVALSGPGFEKLLDERNIAYLQGDWTNRDPEITRFLERFGRAGVPLYVIFPADGGAPRVLPQILKPGALRDALTTNASGSA